MSPLSIMRKVLFIALSFFDITFSFGEGVYVNYLGAIVSLTILSIGIYHVTRLFGLFTTDNGKD